MHVLRHDVEVHKDARTDDAAHDDHGGVKAAELVGQPRGGRYALLVFMDGVIILAFCAHLDFVISLHAEGIKNHRSFVIIQYSCKWT